MEGRHDLPEVGFVKVPCDDRGSVRVFVDAAAELIVEFGQSQARVCLWWNVNGSSDDRWKLPGQIEWAVLHFVFYLMSMWLFLRCVYLF